MCVHCRHFSVPVRKKREKKEGERLRENELAEIEAGTAISHANPTALSSLLMIHLQRRHLSLSVKVRPPVSESSKTGSGTGVSGRDVLLAAGYCQGGF